MVHGVLLTEGDKNTNTKRPVALSTMSFRKVTVTDTLALATITTTPRFIGYYPDGISSVGIGACYSPWDTFFVTTKNSSWIGGCCGPPNCFLWYTATGRVASFMSENRVGSDTCGYDYVTLSIFSDHDLSATAPTTLFWCPAATTSSPQTKMWRDISEWLRKEPTTKHPLATITKTAPTTEPTSSIAAPPTAASSSISSGETSGDSQVWIVGAVLGPLVACVLVAALVFFVTRRKYQRKSLQGGAPQRQYPHDNDQMVAVRGYKSVPRKDDARISNGVSHWAAPYGNGQSMSGSMYDYDDPVRVR